LQVIENLQELDDTEEQTYEGIEDIWPEYEAGSDDLFFSDDDETNEY
jgi:hypothetical protein